METLKTTFFETVMISFISAPYPYVVFMSATC